MELVCDRLSSAGVPSRVRQLVMSDTAGVKTSAITGLARLAARHQPTYDTQELQPYVRSSAQLAVVSPAEIRPEPPQREQGNRWMGRLRGPAAGLRLPNGLRTTRPWP